MVFEFEPRISLMKTKITLALVAIIACLQLPSRGLASQITWQADFQAGLYDSFGNGLDSTFSFELGVFANGFVPTDSNLGDWGSHWVVFDSAIFGFGWEVQDQYFISSAELAGDGTSSSPRATLGGVFTEGDPFYLWVFNDKAYSAGNEWALVYDQFMFGNNGDSWHVPTPGLGPANSVEMNLQSMDTAIVGGVNEVRGGGQAPAVDPGIYQLQTHAVPEPSGVLMVLLAGLTCGWVRHRKH